MADPITFLSAVAGPTLFHSVSVFSEAACKNKLSILDLFPTQGEPFQDQPLKPRSPWGPTLVMRHPQVGLSRGLRRRIDDHHSPLPAPTISVAALATALETCFTAVESRCIQHSPPFSRGGRMCVPTRVYHQVPSASVASSESCTSKSPS